MIMLALSPEMLRLAVCWVLVPAALTAGIWPTVQGFRAYWDD
jgi:hypothetical protein